MSEPVPKCAGSHTTAGEATRLSKIELEVTFSPTRYTFRFSRMGGFCAERRKQLTEKPHYEPPFFCVLRRVVHIGVAGHACYAVFVQPTDFLCRPVIVQSPQGEMKRRQTAPAPVRQSSRRAFRAHRTYRSRRCGRSETPGFASRRARWRADGR
jgi:hypothetical protein